MNRRTRRSAEKKAKNTPTTTPVSAPNKPLPTAPVVADPGRPGMFLRIVAKVLLSRFALKRVNHAQVLHLLREVARQSGRMDALMQIQEKLKLNER